MWRPQGCATPTSMRQVVIGPRSRLRRSSPVTKVSDVVERVGEGVVRVREGGRPSRGAVARMGMRGVRGASGWETLCPYVRHTGYSINGAFAECVVADAQFVGPVPIGIDPLDASPATCCGCDDLSTSSRRSSTSPNTSVLRTPSIQRLTTRSKRSGLSVAPTVQSPERRRQLPASKRWPV